MNSKDGDAEIIRPPAFSEGDSKRMRACLSLDCGWAQPGHPSPCASVSPDVKGRGRGSAHPRRVVGHRRWYGDSCWEQLWGPQASQVFLCHGCCFQFPVGGGGNSYRAQVMCRGLRGGRDWTKREFCSPSPFPRFQRIPPVPLVIVISLCIHYF